MRERASVGTWPGTRGLAAVHVHGGGRRWPPDRDLHRPRMQEHLVLAALSGSRRCGGLSGTPDGLRELWGVPWLRSRLPCVLLPASREQINRLGRRLAADGPVSDDDLHLLEELTACHMAALELARPRFSGMAKQVGTGPLHITHQAKTTQTIIEKLRREQGMNLARVQDLAGIRVVGSMGLELQDQAAAEVAVRFPADPREARIVDRRASPSHGYRAVHVVVSLAGVSIEVQVRTLMQHLWADLMERLADRLGCQIRYGGSPVPPPGMPPESAQAIVGMMMNLSASWAEMESAADHLSVDAEEMSHVDRIADQAWDAMLRALRNSGIDL